MQNSLVSWASASLGLSPRGEEKKQETSVDEVLLKVREAERALQQAREALTAFSTLHQNVNVAPELTNAPTQNVFGAPSASQDLTAFRNADHSRSSRTQFLEVSKITSKEKARLRKIFDSVDKDGSDKVSAVELRAMLEKAEVAVSDTDVSELRERIHLHDKDGDGHLDFEEFCKAFGYSKAHAEAQRKQELKDLQKDTRQVQQDNMPAEQYVQIYGVSTAAVTRYLRKELDETSACLQLPQAFCIFMLFFLSVSWHFDYSRLHGVDQAITWDIQENANFAFTGVAPFENGRMGHKNINDVNSIADFWSWINLGLVPLFWPESWDVNEARVNALYQCFGPREILDWWGQFPGVDGNYSSAGSPGFGGRCPDDGHVNISEDTRQLYGDTSQSGTPMVGTYLYFHKIIGGMRLRQERTPLTACTASVEDLKGSVYRGMCTKTSDNWLKPELHQGLSIDMSLVDTPGGETVHLLSRRSQTQIRGELKRLEDRSWFSPQTQKIELLFTTYNQHEDLITATYIMFFLNRGGHIHKIVEPVSFHLDPYHSGYMCYIWDIAWACLCVKLFLDESWEIIKHWRQLGFGKGTLVYMNMSNAVDWVSIAVAVLLAVFWGIHLQNLWDLRAMLLNASPTREGTFSTGAERDAFYESVDMRVRDVHNLRNILAIYPFVIVSRFFKAFSMQPRLAMVTMTLSKAAVDITHFVVVFGTVFCIFGFSAMILWGQEIEHFANEMRSLHTLFRILLGDFDWEEMHAVGRPQAYVWFWCFVWIVNMVMLNMLLAIIMDVYTDVKAGIGTGAETLWSQSIEIYRRWRAVALGRSVSLRKVLTSLDPTDLESEDSEAEDEVLYAEMLVERIPKMKQEQALQLLIDSHKLKISDERSSETLSDAMMRISKIDKKTDIMMEHISRFIQAQPVHPVLHHETTSIRLNKPVVV